MTTEDDFQRALDADPNDWQTRLVFADWLDEHGDPRAEGYRALGLLRKVPLSAGTGRAWFANGTYYGSWRGTLPPNWFRLVRSPGKCDRFTGGGEPRREVEDAAALAFATLPAEVRAELLNLQPAGAA